MMMQKPNPTGRKVGAVPTRRWHAIRRVAYWGAACVAACVLSWFGGFLAFVSMLPQTATLPAKADAIVVLTGGSLRLQAGVMLLEEGYASKLFVSGVHKSAGLKSISAALQSEHNRAPIPPSAEDNSGTQPRPPDKIPDLSELNITLGHEALTTVGNAREVAAWIKGQKIKTVILVTSSYHMPRSMAEFQYAMPDVEFHPYAVFSKEVRQDSWWHWPGTFVLLASEFNKYLIVRLWHQVM
jgi:uncharacterized SAM-binding protein YcdF (DUF218 family)